MAILVPDDKLHCFVVTREKLAWKKWSSFSSGTSTATYGTIAGARKPSRWTVTLMDALTLGSLVDCYYQ